MSEPLSSSCDGHGDETGDGRDWYLVLCLGGIQAIVQAEVERHLTAAGHRAEVRVFNEDCRGAPLFDGVHNGQAGCGKLILATDASPEILRTIRCVQGLFALVAHGASLEIGLPTTAEDTGGDSPRDTECAMTSGSLPRSSETAAAPAEDLSPLEAALGRLESLVTRAPLWPAAVQVWQRFRAAQARRSVPASDAVVTNAGGAGCINQPPEHSANGPGDEEMLGENAPRAGGDVDITRLKFRFSVVRDGRHAFGSVEASPRLGAAVASVHSGWTVDLKEYDVEVVAFVLERGVAVGLALDGDKTKRCSHGRIPKEDKGFLETGKRVSSLRPSTAYLMLCLAKPTAGDIVVDCMCGIGTVPFLGAGWFPDAFFLGGEVDDNAIDHLRRNGQSLRRSSAGPARAAGAAAACAWDAQCLPLRDSSVDVVVVDMPFGQSCGTPRKNAKLYPAVMAEMARVLRLGSGRCVLLVAQPHLLGLPGLRRDNQKERKKLRKQGRERACELGIIHHSSSSGAAAASGKQNRGRRQEGGRAISEQGGGSADDGVEVGATDGGQQLGTGSAAKEQRKANPQQGVAMDAASLTPQKVTALEPQQESEKSVGTSPGALWRICARHTVNVGGLISYVLVLDRTHAPSLPLPRSYRRKRLVGMDAYCKHRRGDEG